MKKELAFLAASVAFAGTLSIPAAAAAVDESETRVTGATEQAAVAENRGVLRTSLRCRRPAARKIRYSWSTDGSNSTTVYFNNHCSHRVTAELEFRAHDGRKTQRCMTVNAGTNGKKRFWVRGFKLKEITRGC